MWRSQCIEEDDRYIMYILINQAELEASHYNMHTVKGNRRDASQTKPTLHRD